MANTTIPTNYVENVKRSAKNLSKPVRYTTMFGLNTPCFFKEVKPDDYFKVKAGTLLQSEPLIAPVMATIKLREIAFYEPYSNLYGWYDNNSKLTTQELLSKNHHRFLFPASVSDNQDDYYTPQLNNSEPSGDGGTFVAGTPRGGIFDFIGVPPGTCRMNTDDESENNFIIPVDRILAYIDVVRSYLRNTQEDNIPYIMYSSSTPENELLNFEHVSIKTLDKLFKELRYADDGILFSEDANFNPDSGLYWFNQYLLRSLNGTNSGIFLAMYEPDFYNNFLNNKIGTVKSVVDTSGGSFSIHELYYRNKVQRIIDRYDISGGILKDWSKTLWGKSVKRSVDIPDIIAASNRIIDTRSITITANGYSPVPEDESYAGQVTGQLNSASKGLKYRYAFDMEGIVIHVSSLIPMPDYSQGLDPALKSFDFASDYKVQLQQLGFQNIPAMLYNNLPNVNNAGHIVPSTGSNLRPHYDQTIGKQIAWLELMTDTGRVHGQFSNFGNKEFWSFNRPFVRYEEGPIVNTNPDIDDVITYVPKDIEITRYINPLDWQYIFARGSLSDHNLYMQHGYNIKAIRPIGKRFMPDFK